MSTTQGSNTWITGWTADQPLQIGYTHVPADGGSWTVGEGGYDFRDLGLSEVTDGRMGVRHVRTGDAVSARGEAPWRAHDLDFQFFYVLEGSVKIETEDGARTLKAGDAAYHPPLYRYRAYEPSDDFEAVEITAPAKFETIEGRDAPPPARAGDLDPRRTAIYTEDTDEKYVMAAGPRPFFSYRDLGTRGPTDGRIHIHVVRATGKPGEGTGWHYHTMAQWFMILGGHSDIRVEDGPRIRLETKDTMCIGAGPAMRHNVAPFSGDYAVLEMCVPAEYDTVPVDAPAGATD